MHTVRKLKWLKLKTKQPSCFCSAVTEYTAKKELSLLLIVCYCWFRPVNQSHQEWRRVHTFMRHKIECTFSYRIVNYLWQCIKFVDSSVTNMTKYLLGWQFSFYCVLNNYKFLSTQYMDMSQQPRTNFTGSLVDSMYFQKVSPTKSATVALSVESETDMIKYLDVSPYQTPYLHISWYCRWVWTDSNGGQES